MPHIIVEHSIEISKPKIATLLLNLNQNTAKNAGNFDISQCKSRAVYCQNFIIADGDLAQDFIHISVRIMSGRNAEIRKNLAENLLKITTDFIKDNLSDNLIALSVDVAEMEKEIYQKTVIATK